MAKYALGCFGIVVIGIILILIGGCSSDNRLVGLSQDVDKQWVDPDAIPAAGGPDPQPGQYGVGRGEF